MIREKPPHDQWWTTKTLAQRVYIYCRMEDTLHDPFVHVLYPYGIVHIDFPRYKQLRRDPKDAAVCERWIKRRRKAERQEIAAEMEQWWQDCPPVGRFASHKFMSLLDEKAKLGEPLTKEEQQELAEIEKAEQRSLDRFGTLIGLEIRAFMRRHRRKTKRNRHKEGTEKDRRDDCRERQESPCAPKL